MPGNRTTSLDQRIGKEGRCMHNLSDRLRLKASLRHEVTDSGDGAQRRITRSRQFLVRKRAAIVMAINDDIREGAANVDTERTRHPFVPSLQIAIIQHRGSFFCMGTQSHALHGIDTSVAV